MLNSRTEWLKEMIGEMWFSNEARKNITYLTDVTEHRFAGTEGEMEAAKYISNKFNEYGLDEINIEEFEFNGWERGETLIRVGNSNREIDAISLPYSPSCDLKGELIDLGYGLKDDFRMDIKNKIVIVSSKTPPEEERWIHRKEKYDWAVKGGASGFIFMNHIPGNLKVTGSLRDNRIGEIPGIGISRESGELLKRDVKKGNRNVSLKVRTDYVKRVSRNVTSMLSNNSKNSEILICAHHDGHDISQGALDNAAGVATLLEIAGALSKYRKRLRAGIRFVTFGAEELGLVGSKFYVENRNISNIGLVLNLDCTGNGRDIKIINNGYRQLNNFISEFSNNTDSNVRIVNSKSPHSDHWRFVEKGIPGFHIISRNETGDRGWAHTNADTLDKVDIRDIKDNAIVLTYMIFSLLVSGLIVKE